MSRYPLEFLDFENEQQWRDRVAADCQPSFTTEEHPYDPKARLEGPYIVIRDQSGSGVKGIGWRRKPR
jgi:hypothetical protein